MSTARHRQIAIQAHDRQRGGHDVTDYSWPRVRHARHVAIRALPRTVAGALVVVAARLGAPRPYRTRGKSRGPPPAAGGAVGRVLPVAAVVLLWFGKTE